LSLNSLFLALLFSLSVGSSLRAQNSSVGSESSAETDKDFKFLPIPYINFNRSLGFSLGAIPMAMYSLNKNDTISPQSTSGVMAMWTTNGSSFGMAFSKFYFSEDHWRTTIAGGIVSVNFQTYVDAPIGGFIDYNTNADFLMLEVQRRIIGDWFLGAHYTYTKFKTLFEGQPEPNNTELHGLGLKILRDSRDNVYYPKTGSESEIDWTNYPEFLNELGGINKAELSHNHFFNVREEKDIVALRAYIGFGVGELPFEQQFIVGQSDIRGYTQGAYRGNSIYTIQGEYRWNFTNRIGVVGFLGFATIAGGSATENNGAFLPGIGAGFRYTAFEKNHFNIGLDAAVGRDDWGLYFRIGEAF
jgi:outer membrane protein assembly factor BamA